jgi:hypothetical protein
MLLGRSGTECFSQSPPPATSATAEVIRQLGEVPDDLSAL